MKRQLDLFAPPSIQQEAPVPAGAVFGYGGRSLVVVTSYGSDAAAPVIVEELAPVGAALRGQLGLWSAAGVRRAMTKR